MNKTELLITAAFKWRLQLNLARRAGEVGGTLPAVLNAANEIAVDAFCAGEISFLEITATVARTMEAHEVIAQPTLEDVLAADAWAREAALAPA